MKEITDKDLKRIGEQVKRLRKLSDQSQEELAEILGVSGMTIYRIEKGMTEMSVLMLLRIAAAFRVPVEEILCEED